MEYRLLDNGTGVLLTRQPKLVGDDLTVRFKGFPHAHMTAIFEDDKATFYRELVSGACAIPINKINGDVRVTVVDFGGASDVRYTCEGLCVLRKNGVALVAPSDMDLPARVVELEIACDELRRENKRLVAAVRALDDRITKLLEGYDLI